MKTESEDGSPQEAPETEVYLRPQIVVCGNVRDLVAGMGAVSLDHNGKVSKH